MLNASHLRLVLPTCTNYDIAAPETVSLMVPPMAVRSRQPVMLPSAIVIRAQSGEARLSGTVVFATLLGRLVNVSEAYRLVFDIVDVGQTWANSICACALSAAAGVVLRAVEAHQYDLRNETLMVDHPVLNASHLLVRQNTTLTFMLPVPPSFYSQPIDVILLMPSGAFEANTTATRVRLRTERLMHIEEMHTGAVRRGTEEDSLLQPAPARFATTSWIPNLRAQRRRDSSTPLLHTLEIHLYGDSWVPRLGTPDRFGAHGPTVQLIASLVSAQQETNGWNQVMLASLDASHVARESATKVVIKLPCTANYSILQPETIAIDLPAAALRSDAPIRISADVASSEWARWPPYLVHPMIIHPQVGCLTVASNLVILLLPLPPSSSSSIC